MHTVEDIANGIIDLCRRAQFDEALDRYYSPDIVSVESMALPVVGKEQRGRAAVQAKNDWWGANNEVHGVDVAGPYLGTGRHANQFALQFVFDLTPKGRERFTFTEMALYTVEKGQVAREEFYYPVA
jgi:hypothetical protein